MRRTRFVHYNATSLFLAVGLLTLFCVNNAAQETPNLTQVSFQSPSNGSSPGKIPEITRPRLIRNTNSNRSSDERRTILVTSKSLISKTEIQVFELINEKRKENGLPAIEWSEDMAKIARLHSENMAKFNFFSHTGLDGFMVNDRADALGISNWKAIGENIAYNRGYQNPAEFACERWMMSSTHRENILNRRWKQSGIGVAVTSDGTYYFTQVFVLR